MKRNILAVTLIGLALAAPASAQVLPMGRSSGYIIYGIVYQPNGSPAQRASVRISGTSGLDRQVFTDQNGRYEIREVAGGRYTLFAPSLTDDRLVSDRVQFGTKIVRESADYPYGERQYTVQDPGGHRWTFSQTIQDVNPATWGR